MLFGRCGSSVHVPFGPAWGSGGISCSLMGFHYLWVSCRLGFLCSCPWSLQSLRLSIFSFLRLLCFSAWFFLSDNRHGCYFPWHLQSPNDKKTFKHRKLNVQWNGSVVFLCQCLKLNKLSFWYPCQTSKTCAAVTIQMSCISSSVKQVWTFIFLWPKSA